MKKNLAKLTKTFYLSLAMIPNHLTRQFSPQESDCPFIIPALRNGLTVTVKLKVAQEFKLAKIQIIDKGFTKEIQFKKTELNLWEMSLEKKNI